MTCLEDLSRDKHGSISSQPAIKTGPNRGKRKPEPPGICWVNMGGYCDDSSHDVRRAHHAWASKLACMGFRVGKTIFDVEFYLCTKGGKVVIKDPSLNRDLQGMLDRYDPDRHD
jgi:hypothetical protein